MLMQHLALRSHLTLTEIYFLTMTVSVSTFFNDFALEEVVVAHLTQMGYRLAHRVVGVEPWQAGDSFDVDLIFTDHLAITGDRVIIIPHEALRWSREGFIEHLHRALYAHAPNNPAGEVSEHLLVIGSAAVRRDSETIVEVLIKMRMIDAKSKSISTFHDDELSLALMPTRRNLEIERIMRIQNSTRALFLFKEGRAEFAGAESFVAYQRRLHQELNLGFLIVSSKDRHSKRYINDVTGRLHPFPIFPIRMNALRAIGADGEAAGAHSPSSLQLHRLRFKELAKWLGSTRGDKEQ